MRRWGHSSVVDASTDVLVWGGFGADSARCADARLASVSTLDAEGGKWDVRVAEDQKSSSYVPVARLYHILSTRAAGRPSVLFGGRQGPLRALNDVAVLDMDTLVWTQVEVPDMPALFRHGACWSSAAERYLLIYGGLAEAQDQNGVLRPRLADPKTVHVLDCGVVPYQLRTVQIGGEALPSRHSHTMAVAAGRLCVVGGKLSGRGPLAFSVDVDTLLGSEQQPEWTALTLAEDLDTLYSHTMHVVNDSTLVLVGGIGHTDQVTLLTLEQGAVVQTSSWPLFPSLTTGKAVKHMLIRHASVVVHSDATKVVIVTSGGGINCFSFGSFFSPTVRIELDLATQSLSSAIVVKAPTNGKETQGISTKRSNNNNKPNIGNNKKKTKKKKKKKKNAPQGDAAVEEGEQQQQAKGKKKKVKVKTNQLGPFHAKRLLSAVYHAHAQQQKAARAQGPIEKAAESKTDAGFDTAQSMYVVMADKSTSTESTQEEQLRAIAAYGVTGLALVRGLTRTGVTIVLDAGFASGQLAAGVALVCKLSKTQPVARVVCLRKPQSENPDAAQTILLTYVDAWLEDVSQVEAEDTVVVSVA